MPVPGRPVLVVEDDATVREALGMALGMSGYEVRLATNGQEALDFIEEERPSLVLLDMRMPVLDGWGFARELPTRGVDPPIVVMTTREDAPRTAQQIGAAGFIGKPFDLAELMAKVEKHRIP